MQPLISVIIPVYNKEKYIYELISDLKRQTFTEYECIIVDDGSVDESGKLCDELSRKDERFIVKHTLNYGVSHARNEGINLSQGKYVTFVDADDRIPFNYLEKLYNKITETKVDLLIGSYVKIFQDDRENEKVDYPMKDKIYLFEDILPYFAELQQNYGVFGWCWGKIMLRELVGKIRFKENLKLAEDFDFYLNIYPKVKTIFFDNTCCYGYRQAADNSSVLVDDSKIDYWAQLKVNEHYRDCLIKLGYYNGKNKSIVEEKITNYLFFIIYYKKPDDIQNTVELLSKEIKEELLLIKSNNILKKIVLILVKYNKGKSVQKFFEIYNTMRLILRRNR